MGIQSLPGLHISARVHWLQKLMSTDDLWVLTCLCQQDCIWCHWVYCRSFILYMFCSPLIQEKLELEMQAMKNIKIAQEEVGMVYCCLRVQLIINFPWHCLLVKSTLCCCNCCWYYWWPSCSVLSQSVEWWKFKYSWRVLSVTLEINPDCSIVIREALPFKYQSVYYVSEFRNLLTCFLYTSHIC